MRFRFLLLCSVCLQFLPNQHVPTKIQKEKKNQIENGTFNRLEFVCNINCMAYP